MTQHANPVVIERHGSHVALVRLNVPSRLNAMDEPMAIAFSDAIREIGRDSGIKCVVITGEGRAFSAGGALEMIDRFIEVGPSAMRERIRAFYGRFLAVRELAVPTIAAVSGVAVGAGACLAAACDMRLVAENARFSFGFVKLGIGLGMGSSYFLQRLVGSARAAEFIYTGRMVTADEAREIGLANRIVPTGALVEAALALATEIASHGGPTLRLLKSALRQGENDSLDACLEREAALQSLSFELEDTIEGVAAAREKREPHFKDR